MNSFSFLVIAAALGAGASGIIWYLKGSRKWALEKISKSSGIYVEDYGPELSLLDDTGLPFFMNGYGRFGKCLLRFPEETGMRACYFDYYCTLGKGEKRREKRTTVALFTFQRTGFPDFHLSSEGDARDEISGLEPVDTTAFDKFPPGIKLYGRDPASLKKFFTPQISSCLSEHPGWSAQGSKRHLLLYKGGTLIPAAEYRGFLAEAKKLAFNLA